MNDDDLTRRLRRALRAKAAQVPEPPGAFDATRPATTVATADGVGRGTWRAALVAAAIVAVIAVAATAVVATRAGNDDEPPAVAAPSTTTSTTADETTTTPPSSSSTSTTQRTTTTLSPATTTPQAVGWSGAVTRPDGSIPVDEFNAYLDATRPSWASSAEQVVIELLRLELEPGESWVARPRFESYDDAAGHHVVVTTLNADDSVRSDRYDVTMRRRADGPWRLLTASWAVACQPGRGHQDYSTALCV
jgi:hypothetical protein